MQHFRNYIVGGLLIVGAVVVGSYYTTEQVTKALKDSVASIESELKLQEAQIATVADLTQKNQGDELVKKLVADCSGADRQRFVTLLDKLSVDISRAELTELDTLFYKCARYEADVKMMMASRLEQEVALYERYVTLVASMGKTDKAVDQRVGLWKQVAEQEQKLSADFKRLVDLQRDIIAALLAGESRNSTTITNTLKEVTDVRNGMTVTRSQIENARTELSAL